MAPQNFTSGTDPAQDRPFLRALRDEEFQLREEEMSQWVDDWLDWCGLSEDELVRRHREDDFDYYRDRLAWLSTCGFLGWMPTADRFVITHEASGFAEDKTPSLAAVLPPGRIHDKCFSARRRS